MRTIHTLIAILMIATSIFEIGDDSFWYLTIIAYLIMILGELREINNKEK